MDATEPLLKEGRNSWRIRHADRVAFLIDGDAYFEFLVAAIPQARRTLYIAAWDLDGRIPLRRGRQGDDKRFRLAEFLRAKIADTPDLRVYILYWDFTVIHALEHEWKPLFQIGWQTHGRIRFHLDGEHPAGAAQHQKFVVIDDRVAFCGGIDITHSRWDTPEHRIRDPRRTNPDGRPYRPFHDVQAAVAGEAAAALGELFRERWLRATGESLRTPEAHADIPWPESVPPDLTDVPVAIARTLPAFKEWPEVREIEALFRDALTAARRFIYLENQYLTSQVVAEVLAERLGQEGGPEVVITLPQKASGWLEQNSMDLRRAHILRRLLDADRGHRLRVQYPALDEDHALYVHAKVMVVDDRLLRIGSANMSNRSMGLDSECDLVFEVRDDPRVGEAVRAFRNRLLAEHLGREPENVAAAVEKEGSLIKAIESLSGSGRTLRLLDMEEEGATNSLLPAVSLLDPEEPLPFDRLIDQFVREEAHRPARKRHLLKPLAGLLVLLGLTAAWRWTPLSEWIDMQQLVAWVRAMDGSFLSPLGVVAGYIAGGLLMVPITLLIGATAIVFPPHLGFPYALCGCLANALVTYGIGTWVGRDLIRRAAGRRLNDLSKRLANQGLLSVAVVRNLPVAPFTMVNVVAGASRIKLRDFLLGTAIGMAPGILAITLFTDRLLSAVKDPKWTNIALAAATALVLGVAIWWIKKRISR